METQLTYPADHHLRNSYHPFEHRLWIRPKSNRRRFSAAWLELRRVAVCRVVIRTFTLLKGVFTLVSYKALENSSLKVSSDSESKNFRLHVQTLSVCFAIQIIESCFYMRRNGREVRYTLNIKGNGDKAAYRIEVHIHFIAYLLWDEDLIAFGDIKLI